MQGNKSVEYFEANSIDKMCSFEGLELFELIYKNNSNHNDFHELEQKKWRDHEKIKKCEDVIKWCKGVKSNNYKWTTYYTKSDKCPTFGREYGNGIQRLPKAIRGFLTGDTYTDYDMKNAHPNILCYLCKHYNIDVPSLLLDYVVDRATVLKDNNLTKIEVLATMNKDRLYKCENDWLHNFHKQLKPIKQLLCDKYPELATERTHKLSSVMNKLLCKEEAIILEKAISHFNIENPIKMFDGVMIQNDNTDSISIEGLNEMSADWGIEWDIKEPSPFVYPEGREVIITTLPRGCLINLTPEDKVVLSQSRTYEGVKQKFEENNFVCFNPLEYCTTLVENGEDVLVRDNKTNFFNKYETMYYEHINKKGETEKVQFIGSWIKDITRREYKNINFIPPPGVCPPTTFNLFTGFRYNQLEEEGLVPDDDIQVFLDHFKIMSGSDQTDEIYKYIINFFAHLVQYPGLLPRTAILFNSPPGYGKNMMVDNFGRKIFGNKYHESTSNAERFVGKWKSIMGKFMGVYNEATSKDTFGLDGKMKELITEPMIDFEVKCKTPITIMNFIRMFILTNKDNGVRIDPSDRRFQVIEIAGQKQSQHYFNVYAQAWENDAKVLGLVNFLKKIDISDWNPEQDRVKTEVYKSMISINIHTRERFLVDFVNTLDEKWQENVYTPTRLYNLYAEWMKERNMKPETMTMFGMKLKREDVWGDAIIFKHSGKRGRRYIFDKQLLIDVLIKKGSMIEDQIENDIDLSSDEDDE